MGVEINLENDELALLAVEYESNVDLWQHDDNLRQQRQSNFLNLNTIMLVGIGAVVGLTTDLLNIGITLIIFASFGYLVAAIWQKVQVRSAEYVRFRRHQLMHIEHQLKPMSTFSNTFAAFYPPCQTITFDGNCEEFRISEQALARSTLSEGALPKILAWFWGIVGVVGLALVLYGFIS